MSALRHHPLWPSPLGFWHDFFAGDQPRESQLNPPPDVTCMRSLDRLLRTLLLLFASRLLFPTPDFGHVRAPTSVSKG